MQADKKTTDKKDELSKKGSMEKEDEPSQKAREDAAEASEGKDLLENFPYKKTLVT